MRQLITERSQLVLVCLYKYKYVSATGSHCTYSAWIALQE